MDSLLNASCRFAVEQPEQAICILEKENIFTFGMLTPKVSNVVRLTIKQSPKPKKIYFTSCN